MRRLEMLASEDRSLEHVNQVVREELTTLREREELFHTMTDTAPVMIWRSGPDMRCDYFNKAWLDFTGRTMERELGNGWAKGVHPDDYQRCMTTYVNTFDAHKPFYREFRLLRYDGEYRWILDNGAPRFLSDGAFGGYIGSGVDITERKRALIIEHEQRILAEALRDTALALNGTLEHAEILDCIMAGVGRVVPHDVAEFMLIEAGVARMVRSHGYKQRGLATEVMAARYPVATTPILRQMIETGQPVIIADIKAYEGWINRIHAEWLHSYVGVPVRIKNETIGFINLISDRLGFYTQVHAEHLQIFAEQVGVAIRNARLYEHTQDLAALEERQRLARELHDAVSQTLFSSSIIAESLPCLWKQKPERVLSNLKQLQRLNQAALAEMRNLLMELRPATLLKVDIADLLRQLTQAITGRTRLAVSLKVEGQQDLPPDVQIALYRIAQEALNNAVRHAQATEVTVSLKLRPWKTVLLVKDNGCGFDPDIAPQTGMGLGIIRERANGVGAKFQIKSELGRGTEATVIWEREKGDKSNGAIETDSNHDR